MQLFLKPEGQRLHLARARADERDARRGLSAARAGLPASSTAPIRSSRKPRVCGSRTASRSTRARPDSTRRVSSPRASRCRRTGRSRPTTRRSRICARRRCRSTTELIWNQGWLDVEYRIHDRVGPREVLDQPGVRAARRPHGDRAALPAARRRRARVRAHRRSRARADRSASGIRRRGDSSRWDSSTS